MATEPAADPNVAFLKQVFKQYYFRHATRVEVPPRLPEREFGYEPWGAGMIRHLRLPDAGSLYALLVREAPASAYSSVAYYHDPTAAMNQKGFLGAELAFDIDADNLNLSCKATHDRWICRTCGHAAIGLPPAQCSQCQGTRIQTQAWSCPNCLDATKQEALKIADILEHDLGLGRQHMHFAYSGSLGYHMTIRHPEIEELDQLGRTELADLIAATNLRPELLGYATGLNVDALLPRLPRVTEPGWRGRIARYLQRVQHLTPDQVPTFLAQQYFKLGTLKFRHYLMELVAATRAVIDPGVTIDIHRIFRLPGTLHNRTGLAKMPCRDLLTFNPLVDAVVLGDEPVRVVVSVAPQITLREQTYGPFHNAELALPLFAATFLVARGVAKVK